MMPSRHSLPSSMHADRTVAVSSDQSRGDLGTLAGVQQTPFCILLQLTSIELAMASVREPAAIEKQSGNGEFENSGSNHVKWCDGRNNELEVAATPRGSGFSLSLSLHSALAARCAMLSCSHAMAAALLLLSIPVAFPWNFPLRPPPLPVSFVARSEP